MVDPRRRRRGQNVVDLLRGRPLLRVPQPAPLDHVADLFRALLGAPDLAELAVARGLARDDLVENDRQSKKVGLFADAFAREHLGGSPLEGALERDLGVLAGEDLGEADVGDLAGPVPLFLFFFLFVFLE